MSMTEIPLRVRAKALIQHRRPYDYDEKRGLWVYRKVDEDEEVYNLVTNAGRVAIHTYIYGTSAQRTAGGLSGTGFNYIALSNDASAPAAGDTTLASELSGNGLDRTLGTPTLPTGSGTVTTVENTFTFTGTSQGVQKTALFDDSSAGKMAHEIQFTQRTLATSDNLTITFSITLA